MAYILESESDALKTLKCSDRVILSVGHTNQSSFYVYHRQARGWNYDEPEIHQLDRDYFKEAKGFNPKSFNGFNHMVLVKVQFPHCDENIIT